LHDAEVSKGLAGLWVTLVLAADSCCHIELSEDVGTRKGLCTDGTLRVYEVVVGDDLPFGLEEAIVKKLISLSLCHACVSASCNEAFRVITNAP